MAVSVKLNMRGVNALMASAPVQALLDERAGRIADAAGANFEAVSRPHRWTARAYVQPANFEGMREEARHKSLTRAFDAGR